MEHYIYLGLAIIIALIGLWLIYSGLQENLAPAGLLLNEINNSKLTLPTTEVALGMKGLRLLETAQGTDDILLNY